MPRGKVSKIKAWYGLSGPNFIVDGVEVRFEKMYSGVIFERQPARLFKFTHEDGRSGYNPDFMWSLPTQNADGSWTPGEWMTYENLSQGTPGEIRRCVTGLHAFAGQDINSWVGGSYGHSLWEVEYDGPVSFGSNKFVGAKARLLRPIAIPEDLRAYGRNPAREAGLDRAEKEWLKANATRIKRAYNARVKACRAKMPPEMAKDLDRAVKQRAKGHGPVVYYFRSIASARRRLADASSYLAAVTGEINSDTAQRQRLDAKNTRQLASRLSRGLDINPDTIGGAMTLLCGPRASYYSQKQNLKWNQEEAKIKARADEIEAEIVAEMADTPAISDKLDSQIHDFKSNNTAYDWQQQ